MELKIVYRVLRKISDWSLRGFYSEVYVEGHEEVTRNDPLIVASTHHNEIIDIATLGINVATTIPYRRHLSFWAKSSMFADPLARAVLLSSGAIPVKRNPNNGNGNGNESSSQTSLFRESSIALEHGDVIGVFPEGTSYTLPKIMQVLSGAAWAAVDYVKWTRKQHTRSKELTIVPVGIVYTDKARYQSRVYVKLVFNRILNLQLPYNNRYGEPIMVETYMQEIFRMGADVDAATKSAVKKITAEIERQMRAMTVNAPDWDTLYAAQMARDIIYEDPTNVPLKDWVSVSQSLVDVFTTSSSSPASLGATKTALTAYYSLLHHTGISHSSLTALFPIKPRPPFIRLLRIIIHIPLALFHFIIFLPPMLLYVPAYILGKLAASLLADEGEIEAEAQFKAIFGGVGLGVGLAAAALGVLRKYVNLDLVGKVIPQKATQEGLVGKSKRIMTMLGVTYSSIYLLIRWHNALVNGNYKRLKILLSLHKLCLGLIPQSPASPSDLEKYRRPPTLPPNPFIKKNQVEADSPASASRNPSPTKNVPIRKLVRPLLETREQAYSALEAHLKTRAESFQGVTSKRGA